MLGKLSGLPLWSLMLTDECPSYAADIANRLRGYVGGSCGDSTG